MRSRQEISRILLDDVECAMRKFRASSEEFRKVVQDVPSGLPHPDGSFRVEHASKTKTAAMQELRRALQRHNNFILNNSIPQDLVD